MHRAAALACLALAAIPVPAAAQAIPSCTGRTDVSFVAAFTPASKEWTITPPRLPRISERDRVEVCIEHFNFLRFALSFDIAEEKSEAYQYLTALWTSVLNPTLATFLPAADESGTRPGTPAQEFLKKLQSIYAQSLELDRLVGAELATYTLTGLDRAQAEALQASRTSIRTKLDALNATYAELQRLLLTPEWTAQFSDAIGGTSRIYTAIIDLYRNSTKRTDTFLFASQKTIGIEIRKVGKRDAGTRVTLTLAATAEGGAKTPVADVSYFVESRFPLVAHGGYAFSRLDDVTFQKVKRASEFSEEDLFQQTGANAGSNLFSLMLGWQFLSVGGDGADAGERLGVLFSLGTDVRAPGKKILVGPSVSIYNRVVLTVGATIAKEASGEQQTLEPNVFRILREKPTTALFFAVTTKVH